jgi:hypothetical protein
LIVSSIDWSAWLSADVSDRDHRHSSTGHLRAYHPPMSEQRDGDDRTWQIVETPGQPPAPAPFPAIASTDAGAGRAMPAQLAGRRRWALAVAGLVVVLLATVGGAWVLSNTLTGAPASAGAAAAGYAYLPTSTSVVAELRLDLPAGQQEQLALFLSRFPGFVGAGQLETKLADWADQLVKAATGDRADYRTDLQAFFAGWALVAVTASGSLDAAMPPILGVAGITDQAAAETAMLKLRSPDLSWSAQDVGGVQVWVGSPQATALMPSPSGEAYALTDDVLLVAPSADVISAALATHAAVGSSLLDQPAFSADLARAPAGRLALLWADTHQLSALTTGGGLMPTPGPACAGLTTVPESVLATLYVRDGRALVDITTRLPAGAAPPELSTSSLDDHLPADTFFYAESRAVGSRFTALLDCLRGEPGLADPLAQLEQSMGTLDDLLGWAGDAAVGLRYDGNVVSGGFVVQVNDQARAGEALGELRAALTALGNQAGSVTVNEATYDGARLVEFDFSPLSASAWPAPLPATSLAYALKDNLLVIGVDASFARAVLDTTAANSLASTASYGRALDFSGGRLNAGVAYLDTPAALAVLDRFDQSMPNANGGFADVRDQLAPLDDALVVVLGDNQTRSVRFVLDTRQAP